MVARCHPDFILRSFATSQRVDRASPYRGHEGVLAYLHDVATVWEELNLTPLTFRQAHESVIGFGRVEGRRPGERVLGSITWVVRLRGDLISSIEVFQAADGPSLSHIAARATAGGAPSHGSRQRLAPAQPAAR